MLSSSGRTAAVVLGIIGMGTTLPVAFAQAEAASGLTGDTGIHAADPSVIHTDDGYIALESRSGRTLFVRMAPSLDELAKARPARIWSDTAGLGDVWAPEIVFRRGRYVVYFAAGSGSEHRMYSIDSAEPAANYGEAAEITLPDDKWAIDGLAFAFRGVDYFIWSGWRGDTNVQQDIFVARLDANGKAQAPRIGVSSPDQTWENIARQTPSINEGPQPIVDPAGQLHVVYSANGSWGPNYCLADLRLKAGGDPLDAEAWFKSGGCLFGANDQTLAEGATLAKRAKGVGHHSFILANGEVERTEAMQGPFIYHGVPVEDEPSNFWAARKWYVGGYQWVPDVKYGSNGNSDTGWSLRFTE